MKFRGKVALVTGAGSGIGRASALAFTREGAAVVLADVDRDGGAETQARIEALGGQALFVPTDVSQGDQVAALMERLMERFGRLDFAHNNAGICGAPMPFRDTAESWFDRVMAINLKGVWLTMKREVELMIAGGGGAIVNTASVAGSKSFKDFSSYAVSKHAIVGLTKTVAVEVASLGIRVNAVCPGIIETPMVTAEAGPETLERVLAKVPMARMGQPEEVAQTVVFLCGQGAGFTTGQTFVIDGGASA